MRRGACDWRETVKLTARVLEIKRVQEMLALVALIASCIVIPTPWTLSLHVSVREERVVFFTERLFSGLLLQKPIVPKLLEDML